MLWKQESYLRFMVNAVQDSLPTPSELKSWAGNSGRDGLCPLGCREVDSFMRIICGCQSAVHKRPESRITWRYDSILLAICTCIVDRIQEVSESERKPQYEVPIGFKSTSSKFTASCARPSQATLLERADNWYVQCCIRDDGSQGQNNLPLRDCYRPLKGLLP